MKLVKRFTFDSAHYLPKYAGKCKQLHGHTYTLEVIVDGAVNPDTGMIIDFHDVDQIVKSRILSTLDHHCLNDVIENPTAENVATYILTALQKNIPDFKTSLRLYETGTAYVELESLKG